MDNEVLRWDDVIALWDECRDIAQRLLAREGRAQSVQPSDLVLTALRRQKAGGWRKRFDTLEITWENRAQFFGQMNRAMAQALAERGRKRNRVRRINTVRLERFDPDHFRQRAPKVPELLEALGAALEVLRGLHPDWAKLIEYVFFEGLTQADAADILEIDVRTARRWFFRARVLLVEEVNRILADS